MISRRKQRNNNKDNAAVTNKPDTTAMKRTGSILGENAKEEE